jgi:DNA-binding winged helix-turn-helix (wHTH) protein
VLRRVLGDDSAQRVYIATIRRRGYRFTALVHVEMVPRVEKRADADVEATVANVYS